MEFVGPMFNCQKCPRLANFLAEHRVTYPDWYNGPVPPFGPLDSRLLIVGLAPGLRGANLTGRPFTGDSAGDLLYSTLLSYGFARGSYNRRADDDLKLVDCRITNAVRCVPPKNKPLGVEVNTCGIYLQKEIHSMPKLRVILALGGIAHGAILVAFGERKNSRKFVHGAQHKLSNNLLLADSYHSSRYNTNTGRLTESMFAAIFRNIRGVLAEYEDN